MSPPRDAAGRELLHPVLGLVCAVVLGIVALGLMCFYVGLAIAATASLGDRFLIAGGSVVALSVLIGNIIPMFRESMRAMRDMLPR